MPRLLVVHHTPSPALQAMLEGVIAGARDPELAGVEVVVVPALAAGVPDVLAADGFVLGTPANIGYMSGALKHFFDQVYYPACSPRWARPTGSTCTARATPRARSAPCGRSRRARLA